MTTGDDPVNVDDVDAKRVISRVGFVSASVNPEIVPVNDKSATFTGDDNTIITLYMFPLLVEDTVLVLKYIAGSEKENVLEEVVTDPVNEIDETGAPAGAVYTDTFTPPGEELVNGFDDIPFPTTKFVPFL